MSTSSMRVAGLARVAGLGRVARVFAGALVVATLATACSSSNSPAAGATSTTVPADCASLGTKFSAAMSGFGSTSAPNIGAVFAELDTVLPADLKADAKVLAATFARFDIAVQRSDGDLAKAAIDPDGKAAIVAMGSEKNAAASAALHHYFAIGCTQN